MRQDQEGHQIINNVPIDALCEVALSANDGGRFAKAEAEAAPGFGPPGPPASSIIITNQ